MTSTTDHSAIGPLVLVRLLAAGEKGEYDYEDPEGPRAAAGAPMVGRADGGRVEPGGRRAEGRRAGRVPARQVQEGRGEDRPDRGGPPARRSISWASRRSSPRPPGACSRKTYLPASVLGLPASSDARFKAMGSDPIFKAVLLKRQYNLPTAEVPKLDDAIDALAWKLIGFEGETRKFNVTNVKTAVLNRELGDGRATDFKKAASRLVARDCGAHGATTPRS